MTDTTPPTSEFHSANDTLRFAEAEAAAMKRALQVDEGRLGSLLALAQGAIGDFQQWWVPGRIVETHQEAVATPLIAASRIIFDLASCPSTSIDAEARHRLLLLSAAAFAMHGNFPSAGAVLRLLEAGRPWTEAEIATATLCAPAEWPFPLALQSSERVRNLAVELRLYLATGLDMHRARVWDLFGEVARAEGTAWDGSLSRSSRTILAQHLTLAMSQLLHAGLGPVFNAYVNNVISEGRLCLLPPQRDLIWKGFLSSQSNALVTLPTSTGKTLLAEFALIKSLNEHGSIAIYVAPYIALGRQVYECISKRVPDYVDVRGHFGSFNSASVPLASDRRSILIVTPERLDGILRSDPSLYSRIRAVVFDEAHGLENGARGLRLETLIARLKLQQRTHKSMRIILLSAVLTNGEEVRRWLAHDAVHYDHSWRPTARRIAFWLSTGKLLWLFGNDPLRPSTRNALNGFAEYQLPWNSPQNPTDHPGGVEAQKPGAFSNVSQLALHMHRQGMGPLLVACATKASTRGVASAIAGRLPAQAPPPIVADLISLIGASYPHLRPLSDMLTKRVGYHNASLPPDVRELIEDAINKKELDFVSATTTLAEGVDMPFRSTIVFEWLMGFKDNQAPMSPLVFRNIAGRCGRAGQFVEGDTVVYDNVLGALNFTGDSVRRQAQARLLGDPPPLSSAANDNVSDDALRIVRATLSSQLIASIPENPALDHVERELAATMYATSVGQNPRRLLENLRQELLDTSQGEPFAKAASPMWLTPLGQAANRTGFGTQSCRLILRFLSQVQPEDVGQLAAEVLRAFGTIDEQGNYLLRDITERKRTQFYVKDADLEYLASAWLSGTSYIDAFTNLPAAKRSKAQVTPAVWATGVEYERTASQYDKFVELIEYAFGNYLLWLFRAFAELEPHSNRSLPPVDWAALADLFVTARQLDDASVDNAIIADGLDE